VGCPISLSGWITEDTIFTEIRGLPTEEPASKDSNAAEGQEGGGGWVSLALHGTNSNDKIKPTSDKDDFSDREVLTAILILVESNKQYGYLY
jgi:hypothetical protein